MPDVVAPKLKSGHFASDQVERSGVQIGQRDIREITDCWLPDSQRDLDHS